MKNNRGNSDLMQWVTRFQIDGRRLAESWMGLLPDLDLTTPAIQNEVALRRQQHNAQQAALQAANDAHVIEPWTDEMEQVTYDEPIRLHKQAHADLFPLSQNLVALIFISIAHLSQDRRQSLTSIMTHWSRRMDQYRVVTSGIERSVYRAVLHSENSCGESNDESIRIRWKKSISRS